jgi:hypothetical protein
VSNRPEQKLGQPDHSGAASPETKGKENVEISMVTQEDRRFLLIVDVDRCYADQLGNKLFFSISVPFISMREETHKEKKGSQKKICYY